MSFLSRLLTILAFFQYTQAAPPFRTFAQATPPNLEQLNCFPAESNTNLAPLPVTNCLFALRNFTGMHQNPPNGQVIFTTNITKAEDPKFSTQYVATPQEIAPTGEPKGPECGLAYAVYYGAAPVSGRPDLVVPLRDLKIATNYVIGNCTGGNGPGNGGSIRLITSGAREVDVTVQRGV